MFFFGDNIQDRFLDGLEEVAVFATSGPALSHDVENYAAVRQGAEVLEAVVAVIVPHAIDERETS